MSGGPRDRETLLLYGATPENEETTEVVWTQPDWDEPDQRASQHPRHDDAPRPPVEIEVHVVSNPAALASQKHRVVEIWTKNRSYVLDSQWRCMEVIDLATGQSNPKHPFLGARLVGGQQRLEGRNELSTPVPAPGSEAVFQKTDARNRIRLSMTSRVTRVILHVLRVRVEPQEETRAWGRITSTGMTPRKPGS